MRNALIALGFFLIALSNSAFADGSDMASIYQYQTPAEKFQIWPIFTYLNGSASMNNTSQFFTDIKATGTAEILRAEYGINPNFAVGLDLGMASSTTKPSFKAPRTSANTTIPESIDSSGMINPSIFGLGRFPGIGPGTLTVGLPVYLSMSKHTVDNTTFKSNADTGGSFILPAVGYEMSPAPGTKYGVKLYTTILLSDRKIEDKSFNTTSNETQTGGEHTELSFFYEMPVAQTVLVGAAVAWEGRNGTKTKDKKFTAAGSTTKDDNGSAGFGGGFYAAYLPTENIFIVPTIRWDQTANTSDTSNVKSVSQLNATLYAVFTIF